ncbi:myozenin-3-like [Danio aesculapii]|uniref:myozenin-3-like n=1 Tax=Danio aesculapii TaxID=1142201 RepID=UPI0024C0C205|nr:myozenin-3-like [Danio aesculapii]
MSISSGYSLMQEYGHPQVLDRIQMQKSSSTILPLEENLLGQSATEGEQGSEQFTSEIYITQPGKNSLVTTLKQTVAKKGNPSMLAPGYGGPLKEVPPEKFNVTVIPKSYQSPWEKKPIDRETLLAALNAQLPEANLTTLTPADYKCFNRYPIKR